MYNSRYVNFLLGAGLLTLSAQAVQAGTMGPIVEPQPSYRLLATLTVGPDFVDRGEGNILSLFPPAQHIYTNTSDTQTVLDAGGLLGIEWYFSDKLWAQLGISGYWDGNIHQRGHVVLPTFPGIETLGYGYKISHARVMAEGKLLTTLGNYQALHPYFSWGVGGAYNRAMSYAEFPLIPNIPLLLPFDNHTKTSFTWSVGAGVDYSVTDHLRFGVGYQYTDLGAVSLGITPSSFFTGQTLHFSNLYANQLRFQLSYVV